MRFCYLLNVELYAENKLLIKVWKIEVLKLIQSSQKEKKNHQTCTYSYVIHIMMCVWTFSIAQIVCTQNKVLIVNVYNRKEEPHQCSIETKNYAAFL